MEGWRCLGGARKVGSTLTERQLTAVQSTKPAQKCTSIPTYGSRLSIYALVCDQWKQSYKQLGSSLCPLLTEVYMVELTGESC
jgi:hypothetical protein